MKEGTKSIVVLTVICLIVAAALAVVNNFTAPLIEVADAKAAEEACYVVMPDAAGFEELTGDVLPEGLPSTVKNVYREVNGEGYAIQLSVKGYDTGLVVLCGISSDGTITGTTIVSSNETPSIGGKAEKSSYSDQYLGKTETLEGVEAITGATYTSNGYKSAVQDAFKAFALLERGG